MITEFEDTKPGLENVADIASAELLYSGDWAPAIQSVLSGQISRAHKAISCAASQVIICGGALRDAHYAVPPRDIDIVVGPDFNVKKAIEALGGGWVIAQSMLEAEIAAYIDFFGTKIAAIWTLSHIVAGSGLTDIQIIKWIEIPTVYAVLNRIDFSFNRIAYDGQRILSTPSFAATSLTSQVKYMLPYNPQIAEQVIRLFGCQTRATRLAYRYPDFTFHFPDAA